MSTARGHVPTVRPIGNHGLVRCWKKRALADGIPPTYLHDSFAPRPSLAHRTRPGAPALRPRAGMRGVRQEVNRLPLPDMRGLRLSWGHRRHFEMALAPSPPHSRLKRLDSGSAREGNTGQAVPPLLVRLADALARGWLPPRPLVATTTSTRWRSAPIGWTRMQTDSFVPRTGAALASTPCPSRLCLEIQERGRTRASGPPCKAREGAVAALRRCSATRQGGYEATCRPVRNHETGPNSPAPSPQRIRGHTDRCAVPPAGPGDAVQRPVGVTSEPPGRPFRRSTASRSGAPQSGPAWLRGACPG